MTYKQFNILVWLLRLVSAVIMLQTLIFKFTAAPESVYIFSKLGVEPWGRIVTGIAELVASALILFPKTTGIGALLATGIMTGATLSHIFWIGFSVQGDGGLLFGYALTVLISSIALVLIFKEQIVRSVSFKLK